MMQLAQMLDGYGANQYERACAESGVDVSGDRIIFDFLSSAYRDWLSMDEDAGDEDQDRVLAPHVEAMAREFDQNNSQYLADLEILEADRQRLEKEIEQLEKSGNDLATLDRNFLICKHYSFARRSQQETVPSDLAQNSCARWH